MTVLAPAGRHTDRRLSNPPRLATCRAGGFLLVAVASQLRQGRLRRNNINAFNFCTTQEVLGLYQFRSRMLRGVHSVSRSLGGLAKRCGCHILL